MRTEFAGFLTPTRRSGTVLMFMSVLNYLPDACESLQGREKLRTYADLGNRTSDPEYAASVLASNDFTRSMIGGACPLFAGIMVSAERERFRLSLNADITLSRSSSTSESTG